MPCDNKVITALHPAQGDQNGLSRSEASTTMSSIRCYCHPTAGVICCEPLHSRGIGELGATMSNGNARFPEIELVDARITVVCDRERVARVTLVFCYRVTVFPPIAGIAQLRGRWTEGKAGVALRPRARADKHRGTTKHHHCG